MIDDFIGVLLMLQPGCYIAPEAGAPPPQTHIEYNGFIDPRTGEQGFVCDFSDRILLGAVQMDVPLATFDGSAELKFFVPELTIGIDKNGGTGSGEAPGGGL